MCKRHITTSGADGGDGGDDLEAAAEACGGMGNPFGSGGGDWFTAAAAKGKK